MIISTIQWSTEDIEHLLKENGYKGDKKDIDEYLNNFDVRYFEERCIQFGWEIMQSVIISNQKCDDIKSK